YIAIFRLTAVAPYLKPPFPPALLRGFLPLRTPVEKVFLSKDKMPAISGQGLKAWWLGRVPQPPL
ncbi:MAG: hypothetical protein U0I22_07850, partial [Treponema sp.]|nr:hypothetical protein [Treponema sp.]